MAPTWLPPTLPYWPLAGPFVEARSRGLTKQLIFSSWNVVPKAVASMVSYEVERRIFGRSESRPRNNPEARKRRRPLLRFAQSDGRLSGMPVLGLLYPSVVMARLADPLQPTDGPLQTRAGTLAHAEDALRPKVEALFRSHAARDGREDESCWGCRAGQQLHRGTGVSGSAEQLIDWRALRESSGDGRPRRCERLQPHLRGGRTVGGWTERTGRRIRRPHAHSRGGGRRPRIQPGVGLQLPGMASRSATSRSLIGSIPRSGSYADGGFATLTPVSPTSTGHAAC